jgi:hypothetical protein
MKEVKNSQYTSSFVANYGHTIEKRDNGPHATCGACIAIVMQQCHLCRNSGAVSTLNRRKTTVAVISAVGESQ